MIPLGNRRRQIGFFVFFGLAVLLLGCAGEEDTPKDSGPTINVLPEEILPNAGITVKVNVGQEAVLDGTKSTTLVNAPMSYVWSFTHRPDGSNAVLLNAKTATPKFLADVRGTFIAKLVVKVGGVSSSAAYVSIEALNEFSPPLPRPDHTTTNIIKIDKPCVVCHVGGPGQLIGKSATHIESSDLCQACHSIMGFTTVPFVDHELVVGTCSGCHDGVKAIGKSSQHVETTAECDQCHLNTTSFLTLRPDGTYDHGQIVNNCARCHNGVLAIGHDDDHIITAGDCVLCHNTTAFKPSTFDHTQFTFDCARAGCHTGPPNAKGQPLGHPDTYTAGIDCSVCHNILTFVIGSAFDHSVILSSSLECKSCHEGANAVSIVKPTNHISVTADCGNCHKTDGFKPAFVDHTSELVTGTLANPVRCDSCHNNINVIGLPQPPAVHMPFASPEDCGDRCHTPGTFTSGNYNHIENGAVLNSNCATCHNGTIAITKPDTHIPTAQDCSVCHTPARFVGTVFKHAGIDVKNCALCHNGTISLGKDQFHLPTTNDCSLCHGTDFTTFATGQFHKNVTVTSNCETCHNGVIAAGKTISTHIPTDDDCVVCHSVGAFRPSKFYSDVHVNITSGCADCHTGLYSTITLKVSGKPSNHIETSIQCESCHNLTAFAPVKTVDHTQVIGVCSGCHNGTIARGKSDFHIPTSSECNTCHTTLAFLPANFTHAEITSDCSRSGCHTGEPNAAIGQPIGHPDTNTLNIDCSHCHNTSAFSMGNVFDHSLISNTALTCVACHEGTVAVARVKPTTHLVTSAECGMCHKTIAFKPAYVDHTSEAVTGTVSNPVRCDSCHNNVNAVGLPQPPATHMPVKSPEDCGDRCHTPGSFSTGTYNHIEKGAPLSSNCASCHNDVISIGKPSTHLPTTDDCSLCHKGDFATFSTGLFHKNVTVSNNCLSCHDGVIAIGKSQYTHIPTQDDCSVCHVVGSFKPSNFYADVHVNLTAGCAECHSGQYSTPTITVSAKPKTHINSSIQCEACHGLTSFAPVIKVDHTQVMGTCSTCHNGIIAIGKSNTHLATTAECNSCHNTNAFIPASFSHAEFTSDCSRSGCHTGEPNAALGQPLGHPDTNALKIDCSHCHNTSAFTMNNVFDHRLINSTALLCSACHDGIAPVAVVKIAGHLSTSADCGMCHTTVAFKPAYVDHSSEAVTGTATSPVRCDSCHNNVNQIGMSANHMPVTAPEDCGDRCHTPGSFATGVYNHIENGSVINSNCVSCHNDVITAGKPVTHLPTNEDCSVCHTTDTFLGVKFNHVGIDTSNCAQCHDTGLALGKNVNHLPTTDDCSVCHGTDYTTFKTGKFHANVQVVDGCSTCHNGVISIGKAATHIPTLDECNVCHSVSSFQASIFLTDLHVNITSGCVDCHNGLYTSTNNKIVPGKSPNHMATSNVCEKCHGLTTFAVVAAVDHTQVFGACSECHNGIIAIGKSAQHVPTSGECNNCHTSTTTFFTVDLNGVYDHTNVTNGCSRCHDGTLAIGKPVTHIVTTSECNACHNTTAFKPATVDHTNLTNNCARAGCHTGATNAAIGQPLGHPDTSAVNLDCVYCHNTKSFFMNNTFNHSLISSGVLACAACHEGSNSVAITKPGTHLSTVADCGLCHTTTVFKPAYVDHSSVAVTGTTGNPIRCDSCHNNIDALGLPQPPATHMPYTAPEDCGDRCHTPGTFTSGTYNHIEGGVVLSSNCASCHNNVITLGKPVTHIPTVEDCSICHTTDSFLTAVFSHAGVDIYNCAQCHNGSIALGKDLNHLPTSSDCSLCHANDYTTFKTGQFHANVYVADGCSTCHNAVIATGKPPLVHIPTVDDCHVCHDVGAFHPSRFFADVHINILSGCEGCHNGQFTTANVTVLAKPVTHIPTDQDCDNCHTNLAFLPSTFAHVGINSNCASCHDGNYVAVGALGSTNTLIHSLAVSNKTDCVSCHNITAFKPAYVDHSSTLVTSTSCMSCHDGVNATGKNAKLDGPHVATTQDCGVCHTAGGSFKPAVFDHSNLPANQRCDSCHGISAIGKDAKTNPGHIPTTQDCSVCHNTVAFAGAKYDHTGITSNCSACHGDTAIGKPTYHVPTSQDCSVCHVTTGFIPATFSHDGIVDNCSSCHDGYFAIGKSATHVATTQDCGVCHNTTTFLGAVYDHTGIVDNCARAGCHGDGAIGMDAKVNPPHIPTSEDCVLCHTTATFVGGIWVHGPDTAGRCLDCHIAGGAATPVPTSGHFDTGGIVQCDACHITDAWVPANQFEHCPGSKTSTCSTSTYPGNHNSSVGCINCHTNNSVVVYYPFTTYKPYCAGCHADKFKRVDKHIGGTNGTVEQNKNCGASGCHKVYATWWN